MTLGWRVSGATARRAFLRARVCHAAATLGLAGGVFLASGLAFLTRTSAGVGLAVVGLAILVLALLSARFAMQAAASGRDGPTPDARLMVGIVVELGLLANLSLLLLLDAARATTFS